MIKYFNLRFDIYHHALKLWLENLKQAGVAIVALFPFAMPALVLMPLLSIGIIVKPETTPASFFDALWGYLLVMYAWVNCQKEGILGQGFHHYLSSLPVTNGIRRLASVSVAVYVANFFVVAPALLLIYAVLNISASDPHLLEAFTALGGLVIFSCYYCFAAVKLKTPWLSLFIFPLVLSLSHLELSKLIYVTAWLIVIVLESVSRISFKPRLTKPNKLFSLFFNWEANHPENNKLVLVTGLVILLITKVVTTKVSVEVANHFVNFVAFLYGIVLASNVFSVQKLKTTYSSYFTTLPLNSFTLQMSIIGYSLLKIMLAIAVLWLSEIFAIEQWLLLAGFYASTVLGIVKLPSKFVLLPVGLATLLVVINVVSGPSMGRNMSLTVC